MAVLCKCKDPRSDLRTSSKCQVCMVALKVQMGSSQLATSTGHTGELCVQLKALISLSKVESNEGRFLTSILSLHMHVPSHTQNTRMITLCTYRIRRKLGGVSKYSLLFYNYFWLLQVVCNSIWILKPVFHFLQRSKLGRAADRNCLKSVNRSGERPA